MLPSERRRGLMPTGPRPEIPTRFVRCAFEGAYGTTLWSNVMWLYLTGSGEITVPELNALASAAGNQYATHFGPLLSTAWSISQCKVVLYSSGTDVFEGVGTVGVSGTGSGIDLPAQVAACITWQIAPHYRGGHPRTYLSGITHDWTVDATTFASSFVGYLTDAAAAFHTGLEAISGISSGISSVEHGVASFVRAKAWRDPPVFYRIAGANVDNRIDTQRRRLGRDR
jgi:hypothetical protein